MRQLRDIIAMAALAAALAGSAATGCGGDTACSDDGDCFAGEVCTLGACQEPGPGNGMTVNDAGANDATSSNGATNNVDPNNASMPDASTPDAGGDASTMDDASMPDMTSNDSCIVSPFDVSCESDGNDDFSDLIVNDTKGCLPDDENFKPMDETVSALICALEEQDRYSQNYAECRNRSFVTEVRLTPKAPCDPADIDFRVSMQGKSCANQDESEDVTCSVQPDGSFLAQIVVRPSSVPSIGTLQIAIEPTRENVHFEYDLNVVMR